MLGWGFDKHLDIDKLCLYFQGIRSFLYVHQLRDVAKKKFPFKLCVPYALASIHHHFFFSFQPYLELLINNVGQYG